VAHEAIAEALMVLPHFDVLSDLQYYSITEQTGGNMESIGFEFYIKMLII